MQGSYVGDSIQSVMGIMNGTTNFMLTKMETEGADYAAVLKEAQDLGFAEGRGLISPSFRLFASLLLSAFFVCFVCSCVFLVCFRCCCRCRCCC